MESSQEGRLNRVQHTLICREYERVWPFISPSMDGVDFGSRPADYHMMSSEGPRMSVADVNGDGL